MNTIEFAALAGVLPKAISEARRYYTSGNKRGADSARGASARLEWDKEFVDKVAFLVAAGLPLLTAFRLAGVAELTNDGLLIRGTSKVERPKLPRNGR